MADDFGAREESSLTLQERLQEFFETVSIKWHDFIDAAQEKGIPLRTLNDVFESKGIPGLPAMLFILLVLAVGAFAIFNIVSAPALKAYSVQVVDLQGRPVANASVTLYFTDRDGKASSLVKMTGASGVVSFSDVPASEARASVAASDFESTELRLTVPDGQAAKSISVKLSSQLQTAFALTVSITGPRGADLQLTADNGSIVASASGQLFSSFSVDAGNYTLTASASGFRSETRKVEVTAANVPLSIRMFRNNETSTGPVSVLVLQQSGLLPIANATVTLRNSITDAVLATLYTDQAGSVTPFELPVGTSFFAVARSDNFLSSNSPEYNVSLDGASITMRLIPRTIDNSKNVVVIVNDRAGQPISNPNVDLTCGDQPTQHVVPRDGVAAFDVPVGQTCTATATKDSYLPGRIELTSRDEQPLVLQVATPENSRPLEIAVTDPSGNPVTGATVGLFDKVGYTGVNALTDFDGFARLTAPLGQATLKASSSDLQGVVSLDVIKGNATAQAGGSSPSSFDSLAAGLAGTSVQKVTLAMQPAPTKITFTVLNHFGQREAIAGATINATSTAATGAAALPATCTTTNGTCSVSLQHGQISAVVTAPGFEPLSLSFDAPAGEATQSVELISSSIARDAKLVFVGLYDLKGNKVKTLSPVTTYRAKYVLRNPGVQFTNATAFIQVGPSDVLMEDGPAKIVSYSPTPGAVVVGATDFSLADNFDSTDPARSSALFTSTSSTSSTAAGASRAYKWVAFNFQPFDGSKEFYVDIATSSVESGVVELSHRTSFTLSSTSSDGKQEVLRDPVDASAGVTKAELLANLNDGQRFELSFEGQCQETLCVQAYFEGSTGSQSAFASASTPFQAVVPEQFKLNFKVFSPTPVTLKLTSESDSSDSANTPVQIVSSTLGEQSTAASATAGATVKVDPTQEQSGFFVLKAKQFANDFRLQFQADATDSIDRELHITVANGRNSLKINAAPSTINAFEANKIKLTVGDAFGTPVANAVVVLKAGDALESDVQLEPSNDKPGEYTGEVTPVSFGELTYQVKAPGFRTKSGTITVNAKSVVTVEPTSQVNVQVDSTTLEKGSAITVTNLLSTSSVRVSLTLAPEDTPKYTLLSMSQNALTLKPKESRQIYLQGRVSDDVLTIAPKQNRLTETVAGKIIIRSKSGAFSQTVQVPFTSTTTFNQESIDGVLDYSADSFNFALKPPRQLVDAQSLRVTNRANVPILINQQSDVQGVRVEPASAIIPAGASFEFKVNAAQSFASQQTKCIFDTFQDSGAIHLIASFQGITATKDMQVTVQVDAGQRCFVPGSQALRMPTDITFNFPYGTLASKSPAQDGSMAVRLPTGEIIVFQAGSQVADQRAFLPSGIAVEVSPQYLQVSQNGDVPVYTVAFPFDAVVAIPPSATTSPQGSATKYSTPYADIILPAGNGQQPFYSNNFQPNSFFAAQQPNVGFRGANSFFNSPYQTSSAFFSPTGSVYVPAFTPITFNGKSAQMAGDPFVIGYDEETLFEIPQGAIVQQTGSTISVSFPNCVKLQVRQSKPDSLQTQISDVLPAAMRATFENAALAGGASARRITVQPKGKITVTQCATADDEERSFEAKMRAPTTFVLPPGTTDPRSTGLIASYPQCAELRYASQYKLGVSQVKRLKFTTSAKFKQQLENGAIEIEVPAGDTVLFLSCGASTPSLATSNGGEFDVTAMDGKGLTFDFTDADIAAGNAGKKQSRAVCLNNYRKAILTPAGESYLTDVSGVVVQEAIDVATALAPATTFVRSDAGLDRTKPGQCNNKFLVSAVIPQSSVDGNCVVKDEEFTGSLYFKARDSTGWTSPNVEVPVTIRVKQSSQACKKDQERVASELLKNVFVDYANDVTNLRTGNSFEFTFKGIGPAHTRYLSLLNNLDAPVTVSASGAGTSAVSCAFPSAIPAGDAVAVKCIPTAQTTPSADITLTFTSTLADASTTVKEIRVSVASGSEIYTASPWGELAPQAVGTANTVASHADPDAGSTRTIGNAGGAGSLTTGSAICAKHYCTYNQAQSAYIDFINQLKAVADQKTSTARTQQDACTANPSGYTRTMLLHLANTDQDLAAVINSPPVPTAPYSYSVEGQLGQLNGCGIYKIQAKLDLCSGTQLGRATDEQRRSGSKIQIISAQKLADCPRTLANAPLFLAGKDEEFRVVIGREIGTGINQDAYRRAKGLTETALSIIGGFSLGPYQADANPLDTSTAKTMLHVIYGDQLPDHVQAIMAQRFDNAPFCVANGLKQIASITGTQAVVGSGLLLSGYGATIGARLVYGATQAAVFCGVSATAEGVVTGASTLLHHDKDFVCSTFNACVRSSIFGAIESFLPASKGVTGATVASGRLARLGSVARASLPAGGATVGKTLGTTATYAAVSTGALAALDLVSANFGTHGSHPNVPPGAVAPTAAIAATPIFAYQQAQSQLVQQLADAIANDPDLSHRVVDSGYEISKELIELNSHNPGHAVQAAAAASTTTPLAAMDAAEKAKLQALVNAHSGPDIARQASAIRTSLTGAVKSQAVLDEVYDAIIASNAKDEKAITKVVTDLLKQKAASATTFEELSELYSDDFLKTVAKSGPAQPEILGNIVPTADDLATTTVTSTIEVDAKHVDKFATQVEQASKKGLATSKVQSSRLASFKSKAGKIAKAVGPAALQLGVQLLADVDVRPVEAQLPLNVKNTLVVFHLEDPYSDLNTEPRPTIYRLCTLGSNNVCLPESTFYLAAACPSNLNACIYTYDVPGRDVQYYNLLLAINDQRLDQKRLFESIFLPHAPVYTSAEFGTAKIVSGQLTAKHVEDLKQLDEDTGDESALVTAVQETTSDLQVIDLGG